MAMRFELATRSVTAPDSENFAPLELQDSLTWEILALPVPYQKYIFSDLGNFMRNSNMALDMI